MPAQQAQQAGYSVPPHHCQKAPATAAATLTDAAINPENDFSIWYNMICNDNCIEQQQLWLQRGLLLQVRRENTVAVFGAATIANTTAPSSTAWQGTGWMILLWFKQSLHERWLQAC